jgi:hypothetical protein
LFLKAEINPCFVFRQVDWASTHVTGMRQRSELVESINFNFNGR